MVMQTSVSNCKRLVQPTRESIKIIQNILMLGRCSPRGRCCHHQKQGAHFSEMRTTNWHRSYCYSDTHSPRDQTLSRQWSWGKQPLPWPGPLSLLETHDWLQVRAGAKQRALTLLKFNTVELLRHTAQSMLLSFSPECFWLLSLGTANPALHRK